MYPRNRTTKTFKLNARVSSIPITDDLFDNISEFIVDEKNKFYKSIDGVLYDKDVTILYRFPAAKTGCDYIAPKTLKCVESYAFKNVVGLGTVEFRSEVKFSYLCFYKASFNKLVAENIPRALIDYFGGNNKAYCSNDLKTLVLTNQTSDIPDYFAYNCSLESVSINGTIKSVGVYAFKMNEITELVLPDSVKELKKGSFNQCVKLSVVKFGESLECVGEEAFYGCPLKSVELPVGLKTIGDWAFAFTGIEYVEFPESVTSIGKCAFSGSEIKKTVINENLAGITNEVFQNCTNLEIVVVGSNVKNIGALAFENCASLSTIIIPDNVLSIDSTAFTNANDELVIYCNEGSYAQTYATNNNMKYTTLVLSAIPNQSYTGKEIEPQVSVFANGKELVLDSQYKLTFSDNINVGTAKLTARGLGDFKHLVAKGQFEILPRQLSDVVIIYNDFTYYQPIGTKLNINLYADDNKLTEGEDYEILNWNAGNGVGIYNVTVKGINNILGTYNFTVEVLPRSITVTKITKTGDFKVTDSKYTLVEGVDYNVEVRTDEKGNEETCFVGIGNYTDEKMYSESQRDSTSFISVIMNLLSKLLSGLFNIF